MGKKYGSKDKKEGYLKKNSDYCLVIKNKYEELSREYLRSYTGY